jgi:hypothetical protein
VLLVPLLFAALKLALHALAIPRFGYFRDELYYIACAKHLAWGYVDQPPLSIALLAASRAALGDSLVALRLLPALAGVATVIATGLLARTLGGGRFAQALAALAVVASPIYLGIDHYFSMNALDLLIWTLALWQLARLAGGAPPRGWLALGCLVGLGLLNKLSMAWFVAGLGAATALTPLRRHLATPWPWLGGAVAALLCVPHLWWQVQNGWPTLEFMHNATAHKMAAVSFVDFWKNQLLAMNPLSAVVWVAGLAFCFGSPAGARARALAIVWLVVAAILLAAGRSRTDYLTVAYPGLLAAGGAALERAWARGRRRALRPVLAGLLAAAGLVLAPFGLPLLPVDTYVAYARALGVAPTTEERTGLAELPQHYADMFGWEEMAARVAAAYRGLTPAEQGQVVIFAQNYGEAGALDFFGRRYGLPGAASGHNSYWLWGPGPRSGQVGIILGGRAEDHARTYASVVQVDTVRCAHCMPYERDLGVFVCRGLKVKVSEAWPQVKNYR